MAQDLRDGYGYHINGLVLKEADSLNRETGAYHAKDAATRSYRRSVREDKDRDAGKNRGNQEDSHRPPRPNLPEHENANDVECKEVANEMEDAPMKETESEDAPPLWVIIEMNGIQCTQPIKQFSVGLVAV